MSKHIDKALDMRPIKDIVPSSPTNVVRMNNDSKDYDYARENFYNVIEKGSDALEEMMEVARASEHPRAYEVIATLMKTLVDANKDLVTMTQEKRKEESKESTNDKPITNNNVFVGSVKELQEMLKGNNEDV